MCDDFMKELECPVCLDYMMPPIVMCESGHSICSKCKPNLSKCPYCRQPFLSLRNKALESLSLRVKHPCCYKSYGCQLVYRADVKADHEIECPYRPYTCPFLKDNRIRCQWSGILGDLKEHIQTKHKDRVTDINSWKHVCIRKYKEDSKYTRVIFACDEIFYQQFEVIGSTFYFVVQHVGPENCVSNFQYCFNLAKKDNAEYVSFGFVAESCRVDTETIYRSGRCVKLCYNTVKNFLDKNNNFSFDFLIKKI